MSKSLRSTASRTALALSALAVVALPAAAATYTVDPIHSSAIFRVKHYDAANVYGVFREVSGTLEYLAGESEGLAIDITIQVGSVDTRFERRDTHIKSPDFLSAAEFPTITFKSTRVEPVSDGVYAVTGNLTLRGVTREITVEAERTGETTHPRSGAPLVGFESRFTIDRTDFGVSFMAGPVSEQVEFLIAVEASVE